MLAVIYGLAFVFLLSYEVVDAGGPTTCNCSCGSYSVYGSCGGGYPAAHCNGDPQGSGWCIGSPCGNCNCSLCGPASTVVSATAPTTGLCGWANNAGPVSDQGTYWLWTCSLRVFGSPVINCTSPKPLPIINGICGIANGGSYTVIPTVNLCSSGTATAVAGTGPWTWTCMGANGGTNMNCSANTLPINASCGSNVQTYSYLTAAWPSTAPASWCATGGGLSGAQPTFPSPNGSASWTCLGLFGGLSANCTATRQPLPPTKPTLTGPMTGFVNTAYDFTATATDAAGLNIQYKFDWDNNGVPDQSTGFVASGVPQTLVHTWSLAGPKSLKVEACDTLSNCSAWSDVSTITISDCVADLNPPWSDCSENCGTTGIQTRTLLYTDCHTLVDTQACNRVDCPQWTEVIP